MNEERVSEEMEKDRYVGTESEDSEEDMRGEPNLIRGGFKFYQAYG